LLSTEVFLVMLVSDLLFFEYFLPGALDDLCMNGLEIVELFFLEPEHVFIVGDVLGVPFPYFG
jgi:hypothetical protein